MEKRKRMFHFGGVLGATARSYPMVIRVPSFSRVMSMSISTLSHLNYTDLWTLSSLKCLSPGI